MSNIIYFIIGVMVGVMLVTIFSCGSIDSSIDYKVLKNADYPYTTPYYHMKAGFTDTVEGGQARKQNILNNLDDASNEFLACFYGDPNVGLTSVYSDELQQIVPPLSNLSVLVTEHDFECDVSGGSGLCHGVFFSSREFEGIGVSLNEGEIEYYFRHELAHRYGLRGNHSNLPIFRSCINGNNNIIQEITPNDEDVQIQ